MQDVDGQQRNTDMVKSKMGKKSREKMTGLTVDGRLGRVEKRRQEEEEARRRVCLEMLRYLGVVEVKSEK